MLFIWTHRRDLDTVRSWLNWSLLELDVARLLKLFHNYIYLLDEKTHQIHLIFFLHWKTFSWNSRSQFCQRSYKLQTYFLMKLAKLCTPQDVFHIRDVVGSYEQRTKNCCPPLTLNKWEHLRDFRLQIIAFPQKLFNS